MTSDLGCMRVHSQCHCPSWYDKSEHCESPTVPGEFLYRIPGDPDGPPSALSAPGPSPLIGSGTAAEAHEDARSRLITDIGHGRALILLDPIGS